LAWQASLGARGATGGDRTLVRGGGVHVLWRCRKNRRESRKRDGRTVEISSWGAKMGIGRHADVKCEIWKKGKQQGSNEGVKIREKMRRMLKPPYGKKH